MDFLVQRFSGLSQEDIDMNARMKEKKKLEKEGYKPDDIEKILDGEPKSHFKAEKKKEEKKEEDEGGGGLAL